MARGQSFQDYLAAELAGDEEFAEEWDVAIAELRVAVALAKCRESKGLTQQALAIASGVAQPMISRIEQGDQSPTIPTLVKLLHGLQVSLTIHPDGKAVTTPTGLQPITSPPAWTSPTGVDQQRDYDRTGV